VVIGSGKFGPYVLHDKKYVSMPKELDPLTITLTEAINLILDKRQQDQQRHLKSFDADGKMDIMNGRYGPYIAYNGKNYRIPKAQQEKAEELTLEECMEIINSAPQTKPTRRRKS
jgi:DNA topoisomerase-1